MKINGIQAGMMESQGKGTLNQKDKAIEFHDNAGKLIARWYAATSKDAAQQIRIFRAAPKHIENMRHLGEGLR